MHEAGYDALGIDARYVTFEPAADAAAAAVDGAAALGVAGLNVTLPFQPHVLAAVDAAPPAARIGAVNTVLFPAAEPPRGYHPAAAGVTRAFDAPDVPLRGTHAAAVGRGGADTPPSRRAGSRTRLSTQHPCR